MFQILKILTFAIKIACKYTTFFNIKYPATFFLLNIVPRVKKTLFLQRINNYFLYLYGIFINLTSKTTCSKYQQELTLAAPTPP